MEATTKALNWPGAEVQESTEQRPPAEQSSNTTPQEFYAEFTRRADVREILEELAAG
ncbi:MAG: hypothetical protein K0S78_2320 [Thermomicrobiales bacterium]|jgi:hypothetical protein|nr:hypothetical protein [Thermomicrobiales bacterium]MDF3039323.1 hypothetical protein [Thermomicrobiales bacterium]